MKEANRAMNERYKAIAAKAVEDWWRGTLSLEWLTDQRFKCLKNEVRIACENAAASALGQNASELYSLRQKLARISAALEGK